MTLTPNQYDIRLKDAVGNVLCPKIDNYVSFEYTKSVNNVGACNLVMSDSDIIKTVNSWDKFKTDGRIEVWRSINGAPLYLDGLYFIRKFSRDLSERGEQTMTFVGEDCISLLKRRTTNVKPKNATVNIKVADYADDVIKDLFKNYLGASAGAGFDLSAYITQQVDQSAAQTITKQFPASNVLQVMQEIAQSSTELGTYLAFDIVADGNTMEFRTYTAQRGIDRRASIVGAALLIGPEVGNVLACHYEDDHTNEATYLVNGNQTASSSEREGVSPFGRIMKVISSAPSGSNAQKLADAKAQLRYNRPKRVFTASMIQTEGCLYGLHYGYGDFVTVSFWDQQYDCHLDAVDIRLGDSQEQVNCIFRGEYQAWL